jgi:predicted ATPase
MLTTLAIANYRSIRGLVLPLGRLNVVTGANGVGKSNLYKALRLLADTAQGGVIATLAREGGLESTLWAGPENLTRRMKRGEVPVQGGPRQERVNLRLGFCDDELGYAIDFGVPMPTTSMFAHDPEIKRECIFAAPAYRPSGLLVDRRNQFVKVRDLADDAERANPARGAKARRTPRASDDGGSLGDKGALATTEGWDVLTTQLPLYEGMLSHPFDPRRAPELLTLRDTVRTWRFYDHFRVDAESPARQPVVGTRTSVLAADGRDLAAALQTIREIGDAPALDAAIDDAFPGARVQTVAADGRMKLEFHQPGLLRPLSAAELSDGTLRFLLWVAALLTPRPPALMVLNEPETSLHPDLLPSLARLIAQAATQSQVWVVSHASRLVAALNETKDCNAIVLDKPHGETEVLGQGIADGPVWRWPER